MSDEAKFIAAAGAAISCGVAEIGLIGFGEVTCCSAMVAARNTRSAMLSEEPLVSAAIFDRKASLSRAPRAADSRRHELHYPRPLYFVLFRPKSWAWRRC
jgi:hypothetical protein